MAKAKSTQRRAAPKVRLVKPTGRNYQLRYLDPDVGKEIRIGTKTSDVAEAGRQKEDLEAKLRLGIEPERRVRQHGPAMLWSDFRHEYSRLKQWRSENGSYSADYRLDVCERVIDPKRLRDMARPETLARLQAELATTRSEHTVTGYMATLLAALNWAHKDMGWLPAPVAFKRAKTTDLETHKGRPITPAEFEAMLAACDKVCRFDPESWKFLLRGLWETGLRLAEALMVSWDVPKTIQPLRHRGGTIVLQIPAKLQKSKRDQTLGTAPGFAALLETVPETERTGWIFRPTKQRGEGRLADPRRVGRIISRIGEAAEVFVNEEDKPASAHDLRRSFGQRLADAGVRPLLLQSIMRHRELKTTQRYYLRSNAADQSEELAAYLGTLGDTAVDDPKTEKAGKES